MKSGIHPSLRLEKEGEKLVTYRLGRRLLYPERRNPSQPSFRKGRRKKVSEH